MLKLFCSDSRCPNKFISFPINKTYKMSYGIGKEEIHTYHCPLCRNMIASETKGE